jgi:hypothetical protein
LVESDILGLTFDVYDEDRPTDFCVLWVKPDPRPTWARPNLGGEVQATGDIEEVAGCWRARHIPDGHRRFAFETLPCASPELALDELAKRLRNA